MEQKELITLAYQAFSEFKKPEHSTDYQCCRGCEEYDLLLKDVDRKNLTIEQIGTVCWSPVAVLLPEAMAYYMPRFIELALMNVDNKDKDPYITQFINQIGHTPTSKAFSLFTSKHISIVAETYKYINENYRKIVEDLCWDEDLDEAIKGWVANPIKH